jgi:transposase
LLDTALSGGLQIADVDEEEAAMIAVGVDTHKHEHVVRGLDDLGQPRGGLTIAADRHGYGALLEWLGELGEDAIVGIEGTGSYGAGLCEFLLAAGVEVVEVERPRREDRRHGKSDAIAALLAARKVLAGDGVCSPRAGGNRRALAALLSAYRSCISERTRVLNHLQALHMTAPLALRERIGSGNGAVLAARLQHMRARPAATEPERVVLGVLRDLAARARALTAQADSYRRCISELIAALAPDLLAQPGVGPISAARLLVFDARRLKSEAAFARCNGTAPKPASSGQTIRHRLNRGGDRQINLALHTIALIRSVHDPRTQAYLQRRMREGKTRREAMRALKRHLSRSLYKTLLEVSLT